MHTYLSILARKQKYFLKNKNFDFDFPESCQNVGSNPTRRAIPYTVDYIINYKNKKELI